MYHCLFEQSGTFKNEFKKLGYEAQDYDIRNDFNETDNVVDLYNQILVEYDNLHNERERERTIFGGIKEDELVIAFFPCIRFENQALLQFRGDNSGMKKWTDLAKLEYDIEHHKELALNYELITKLCIIAIMRKFKLIIENPYSTQHYLQRYWCLKPKVIDEDRTQTGDYFKKPTQYWFINCEPKNNFIFEGVDIKKKKTINNTKNQVQRSMISKDYANRFIREYIIDIEN